MLAEELASSIVQLYGEGIERIFAALGRDGLSAAQARELLVNDGVVASLMLIHGIYPVPLEERVVEALDSVRPYMESHGGDVELVGVEDGVAQLRLRATARAARRRARRSSWRSRRRSRTSRPTCSGSRSRASSSRAGPRASPARSRCRWPASAVVELEGVAALARGSARRRRRRGLHGGQRRRHAARLPRRVRGLRRRRCSAACSTAARSTCAALRHAFDLPRAGRCRDDEDLQLEPVPLLRNNGTRAGGGRRMSPAGGLRQLAAWAGRARRRRARRARRRDAASCARSASARTTATCCTSSERRIVCVCETCWSLRSGDPEFRPPGGRVAVAGRLRPRRTSSGRRSRSRSASPS